MNTLNCNEFEAELNRSVETRTGPNDRLRAHAASCAACGERWKEHQMLERAIGEWNAATPAADLTDRVVAGWRSYVATAVVPPQQAPARPARGVLAVATASVVLMAAALLFSRPGNDNFRPVRVPSNNTVADRSPNPEQKAAPETDEVNVEDIVAGFHSQYSDFKKDVSTMMAGVKVEWPAIDANPLAGNARSKSANSKAMKRKKLTNSQPKQPATWQTSLSPIPRDVRKAFGFLKQAVPQFERPST